jgi:hypothetical protein
MAQHLLPVLYAEDLAPTPSEPAIPIDVINSPTHNLIYWSDGTLERIWKPEGIRAKQQSLPARKFVMPCRSLCGFDLKRPHVPCFAYCRLRRTYYGKMPERIKVKRIALYVREDRHLAPVKDALLKAVMTVAEILAN